MDELKKCPFCAEAIQAAAIKCRYCHSDLAARAGSGIITIEQTAKTVKINILLGWGLLIASILMLFSNDLRLFGGVLIVPAIFWIAAARISRWWKNG